MSGRRALVLAALAAAGVVAVALAALHRPSTGSVRLVGVPVTTLRTVAPAEPQFGDTVVATLEVFVDPRRVDPAAVRIGERFAPYTVVSQTRSTRRSNGLSILRIVTRLDCLETACVPGGTSRTVHFPQVRVSYPRGSVVTDWPAFRVQARTLPSDLLHPMLRVERPHAQSGYRLPPAATGWTLLALAAVALAGGLTLLARAAAPVWRRRRSATAPLERILQELASANGDAGLRRRALEELGRELESLDEELSFESRVLAWAPAAPHAAAIDDLARRVREAASR